MSDDQIKRLDRGRLLERVAQITAHRVCCDGEHDPSNGKIHGYCVVCGIPWPCKYAGPHPSAYKEVCADLAHMRWAVRLAHDYMTGCTFAHECKKCGHVETGLKFATCKHPDYLSAVKSLGVGTEDETKPSTDEKERPDG